MLITLQLCSAPPGSLDHDGSGVPALHSHGQTRLFSVLHGLISSFETHGNRSIHVWLPGAKFYTKFCSSSILNYTEHSSHQTQVTFEAHTCHMKICADVDSRKQPCESSRTCCCFSGGRSTRCLALAVLWGTTLRRRGWQPSCLSCCSQSNSCRHAHQQSDIQIQATTKDLMSAAERMD